MKKFLQQFCTKPQRVSYKKLTHSDIEYFLSFLEPSQLVQDVQDLEIYNTDWTKKYKGSTIFPKTTQQVSQILKFCNQENIAVVPQGGNTGLVGGSTPVHDEIVLSLKKMGTIYSFDNGVISLEAGVILQQASDFLTQFGQEMPYDLGAKGSCSVGGNIATHAAGKYILRNGPLRGYVLGLKVVLANGSILDLRSTLQKDNTGPDLKQLFIGSEGTLGVITQIDIKTVPILKNKRVLFVEVKDYDSVLKILDISKNLLRQNLIAFEYIDSYGYNLVFKSRFKVPFQAQQGNYYVLLEYNDQKNEEDSDFLEKFQESIKVENAVLSNSVAEYNDLWTVREVVSVVCSDKGITHKYDISLEPQQFDSFVQKWREKVGLKGTTLGYGHVGDGNLHLNIICQDDPDIVQHILEPELFKDIQKMRGSISAEHGLGLQKGKYLHLQKDDLVVQNMKSLKQLFDPKNILNPYKVFN